MPFFEVVLSNYPNADPCNAKDNKGQKLFKNQCASRISHALKKSGVNFATFPKSRKCWLHPNDDHVLAASELADWLEKHPHALIKPSAR